MNDTRLFLRYIDDEGRLREDFNAKLKADMTEIFSDHVSFLCFSPRRINPVAIRWEGTKVMALVFSPNKAVVQIRTEGTRCQNEILDAAILWSIKMGFRNFVASHPYTIERLMGVPYITSTGQGVFAPIFIPEDKKLGCYASFI